ncbi:MAG: OmpA family protein [Pseudomonadota bacterium]
MKDPQNKTPAPALPAAAAPLLPRRALFAAALSAVTAALAAWLLWVGFLGAPTTETFQFSRGTSFSQGEDARLAGFLTRAAQDPSLQVIVIGHTGEQGDVAANLELSEARAAQVVEMAEGMGISADRLFASGVAGSAPLRRPEDVSDRAFQSSLARVDVSLRAAP